LSSGHTSNIFGSTPRGALEKDGVLIGVVLILLFSFGGGCRVHCLHFSMIIDISLSLLSHFFSILSFSIGELNIGFVPNRVVADGRIKRPSTISSSSGSSIGGGGGGGNGGGGGSGGGRVLRWWDGTAGNVLKGPHGKSRGNRSHELLDELQELLRS
jgi:hypothetical protein